MATLENLSSGSSSYLAARHLVGRSRSCHLCIDKPNVSGVHAEIVWDGAGWHIQDLGSRNGTFVDGRKLGAGEQASLDSGSELVFGVPSNRYRLVDDAPPWLMALAANGELCLAEDGLLCLPSPNAAEVTIFRDPDDRWFVEAGDGTRTIEDQEWVIAGGRSWRVCLPAKCSRTRDAEAMLEPALDEIELEFMVSRDGEHVGLKLVHGGAERELESRAHVELLLALARCRLSDAAQDHLPASEHGWVYRDELFKMLAIDPPLLNLWVYRARRQLLDAGIRGAAGVIERRSRSQQMRLGVERLVVSGT